MLTSLTIPTVLAYCIYYACYIYHAYYAYNVYDSCLAYYADSASRGAFWGRASQIIACAAKDVLTFK